MLLEREEWLVLLSSSKRKEEATSGAISPSTIAYHTHNSAELVNTSDMLSRSPITSSAVSVTTETTLWPLVASARQARHRTDLTATPAEASATSSAADQICYPRLMQASRQTSQGDESFAGPHSSGFGSWLSPMVGRWLPGGGAGAFFLPSGVCRR